MKIEVSNGEILDKVSILEIKLERISDVQKLSNIQNEWDALQNAVKIITGLANPKEEFHQRRALKWVGLQHLAGSLKLPQPLERSFQYVLFAGGLFQYLAVSTDLNP